MFVFNKPIGAAPQAVLCCSVPGRPAKVTPYPRRPESEADWRPFSCQGCGTRQQAYILSVQQLRRELLRLRRKMVMWILLGLMLIGAGAIATYLLRDWMTTAPIVILAALTFVRADFISKQLQADEGVRKTVPLVKNTERWSLYHHYRRL